MQIDNEPMELLKKARMRMSQEQLAKVLNKSAKTIGRWERGESPCPSLAIAALNDAIRAGGAIDRGAFTFIDLFAGIGGTRLGFERAGGSCVFTSEWNQFSQKTYLSNFGDGHRFAGDITKVHEEEIPDHDVLVAGFPCQPFSLAGVSKKNSLGVPHGFACSTQGTLFFDIERILAKKRPKAFLLENVKNLVSHDGGNTFRVIKQVLEERLGYHISCKVVDAGAWLPQHRERILIVGFQEKTVFDWADLRPPHTVPALKEVLHSEDGNEAAEDPYTLGESARVNPKYVLSSKLWSYLQAYADKHRAAGNGFGFGLVDPGQHTPTRTLSARYHKDGSEILVSRGGRKNPRRLTPRECARLMGFPDDFKIPVSDTQAYRQFGNSVVVPVIEAVAKLIAPRVQEIAEGERTGAHQQSLALG